MLQTVDHLRKQVSASTSRKDKSALGQFLTPSSVAQFMASLFPSDGAYPCRLLDAGAGVGALSAAFLDRCREGSLSFPSVELSAYEIDERLHDPLLEHLSQYQGVKLNIAIGDYITLSVDPRTSEKGYTHAILNPPYKKIGSRSEHRLALRQLGIETVNLYSGFIGLALLQLDSGGHMVAIIPRSFCNGPYYQAFRDLILDQSAIHHIHLFDTRNTAFKDDNVLQETVIIRLQRHGIQGDVTISRSHDDRFSDISSHQHPFEHIVKPDDPKRFIHIPLDAKTTTLDHSSSLRYSLNDLGIKVSTGPIVDYRVKPHLQAMPGSHAFPVIYPSHLHNGVAQWPIESQKKPNAIASNAQTDKLLYQNGFYCAVRRFSSKEERRRIVASLVDPVAFAGYEKIGFENHLNVFHDDKSGLPENIARGLSIYLNSTAVDEYFRQFSGHTQVNVTDLRRITYPSREALSLLGQWAKHQYNISQELIDLKIKELIAK